MRLNKFIAENTGVSRREADEMICAGRVTVATSSSDRPCRLERSREISFRGSKEDMNDELRRMNNAKVARVTKSHGLPRDFVAHNDITEYRDDRQIAVLGQRINPGDQVFIDGKLIKNRAEHITIILNKPVGYLSSRRSQGGDPTIYDLLPAEYKSLKTAGRLDKDSSGLMILSSDGDLIQQLTHPRYQKIKVYEVELDKPLKPLHQQMISDIGIDLPDGKSRFMIEPLQTKDEKLKIREGTQPHGLPPFDFAQGKLSRLRRLAMTSQHQLASRLTDQPTNRPADQRTNRLADQLTNRLIVTMHEGRNRQIRRTFSALGYDVIKLHRTNLGPYSLDSLKPGKFKLA